MLLNKAYNRNVITFFYNILKLVVIVYIFTKHMLYIRRYCCFSDHRPISMLSFLLPFDLIFCLMHRFSISKIIDFVWKDRILSVPNYMSNLFLLNNGKPVCFTRPGQAIHPCSRYSTLLIKGKLWYINSSIPEKKYSSITSYIRYRHRCRMVRYSIHTKDWLNFGFKLHHIVFKYRFYLDMLKEIWIIITSKMILKPTVLYFKK
jgi:hypothetical protein